MRLSNKASFFIITFLSVASIFLFRTVNIDLWVTQHFFQPDAALVWPWQNVFWVNALYDSVQYMTLGLLLLCVFVLIAAQFNQHLKPYKHTVILLLSVLIIAPGLIVNLGFKEHWGRPRPSETAQFSGKADFMPLFQYSAAGAGQFYSFPSGHSSVPFAFIGFWFALRKKHRLSARLALGFTLLAGCAVGAARIVAGGHYLSDVLWSGLIAYFVAAGLTYFLKSDELLLDNVAAISSREKGLLLSLSIILPLALYLRY